MFYCYYYFPVKQAGIVIYRELKLIFAKPGVQKGIIFMV